MHILLLTIRHILYYKFTSESALAVGYAGLNRRDAKRDFVDTLIYPSSERSERDFSDIVCRFSVIY